MALEAPIRNPPGLGRIGGFFMPGVFMSQPHVAPAKRQRTGAPSRRRIDSFFQWLEETGSISAAADRAGLARSTLYQMRRTDEAFAQRWTAALELGIDRLQDDAVARARQGVERPVYRNGRQIGTVTHHDNRLLQFLLRAHRPEIYGERTQPAPQRRPPARPSCSRPFVAVRDVEAAMARPAAPDLDRDQPLVMGVDVARFGADCSAIVLRRGRDARSWPPELLDGLDLMALAGRVARRAAADGAQAVFVDEGGLGAGVVDRLREMGVPGVVGVNFAASAAQPLFANRRAELWGALRGWLAAGCLPADPGLAGDLESVDYTYNERGEIQLERKEDMKRRGLASPDLGDALALTFAGGD